MPLQEKNKKNIVSLSVGLFWAGAFFVLTGILLLFINFYPLINLEFDYFLHNFGSKEFSKEEVVNLFDDFGRSDEVNSDNSLYSSFEDFLLFIPKINTKAKIVENVDPFDINVYSKALGKGIAHASVSALPGQNGNTFLFAHSGRNFYDGIHQNVQFYLLDKLNPKDLIYIKFQDKIYKYEITNLKKVWPEDVQYLTNQAYDYNKLTLMSCWPAGINYQRQIVEAKLVSVIQ